VLPNAYPGFRDNCSTLNTKTGYKKSRCFAKLQLAKDGAFFETQSRVSWSLLLRLNLSWAHQSPARNFQCQAGSASVQSAAWASPTVLDGRLSTRFRCRPPSTTVVWCRHMCSATDPYMPAGSCVRSRRTTSVERFADQPPSVWPLPWTVTTGSKNAFVRLCLQGLVTFVFRRWL